METDINVDVQDEDEEESSLPIVEDKELSRRMASYWKSEIEKCDELNEDWFDKGNAIIDRYRDERNKLMDGDNRRLNVLWSNTQIMRPALYSKLPQPNIERRFLDQDKIGRLSATMLERVVRNEIEENGLHSTIKRAVNDMLLPGRGQVWIRYEPEVGEGLSMPAATQTEIEDGEGLIKGDGDRDEEDKQKDIKLEQTGEEVINESICVDYVHWQDFYMFPANARTWQEVQAVGKKVAISKEGCIQRFGEDIGGKIQADVSEYKDVRRNDGNTASTYEVDEKDRVIYEIWSKQDRCVYWVSKGYSYLCDAREDPLELREFFPCPEPLSATLTNDTLIPIPDYIEWQDQAIQLDELTQRINMLTKAIKAAGTYDASNKALRRLLEENVENTLIPAENWASLTQKGGLEGGIFMLPIEQQAKALQILMQMRQSVLEDIDRITGISDILRGTSDARETMGAQRLKSNNAGTRLDERRSDVGRFVRDSIRILAEIAAKHFTEKRLIESSGILYEDEFQSKRDQLKQMQSAPAQGGSMMQSMGNPAQPQGPLGAPPQPSTPSPQMPVHPQAMPAPQMQPPVMHPAPQMTAPLQGAPNMAPGTPPAPQIGQNPPNFPPQQPIQSAPQMLMEMATKIKQAIDLLRDDIPRGYRIDIEIDSMVAGDLGQEREDAVNFISSVTKFISEAGQIVMMNPDIAPLMGKFLQFGVRKFRTGRDLENAIDEYVDKMQKNAQNMQHMPPKPDPKAEKDQVDLQAAKMKAQAEMEKVKMLSDAELANDQRERARQDQMHQFNMQKMQREDDMQKQEHSFRMEEMMMKFHEMNAKQNTLPAAGNSIDKHQGNIDKIADAAEKIHKAAQLHHEAATMPKRIVHGPDGRPAGIVSVPKGSMPNNPMMPMS